MSYYTISLTQRLQNYSEEVAVDVKYHPKIIGRKGQVITKIKEEHKVKNIQFADRNAANPNIITIIGYEKSVQAAKEAILDIVHNLVCTIIKLYLFAQTKTTSLS